MAFFGNKKNKAFGLDISDSSIKVCQLGFSHGKIVPLAFADYALNEKIINNHIIVSEERLAGSIKRAISLAKKVNTPYVVCSILEAKSFVRTMKLPKIAADEIGSAIPYELEQDIPIPIEQAYLDWQIISEADEIELLVNASPKDYVDSLVGSLKLAGLIPVALEFAASATARALVSDVDTSKSFLIVDIGGQQTNFIIMQNNSVVYTSSITIAGRAFTDSIARNLRLNYPTAEKLKIDSGLITSSDEGALRTAVLPILDSVIEEIRNVAKFFDEHIGHGKPLDLILVCGGSARVPGLVDYIEAKINTDGFKTAKVLPGNPWTKIHGYNLNHPTLIRPVAGLSFTTAIGLALRGLQNEEN